MKKVNKGMMITGTFAIALMACSMVSCSGETSTEIIQTANTVAAEIAESAAVTTAPAAAATTAAPKTTEAAKVTETAPATEAAKAPQTTQAAKTAQPAAVTQAAPAAVNLKNITAVDTAEDKYAGSYYEEIAGRGSMTVTKNSDNTYSVHISWSSSAAESSTWDFSGAFDNSGVMYYSNCCMKNYAYDANGSCTYDSYGIMTPYNNYTAGTGSLRYDGSGFIMNDNMGHIIPGTRFASELKKFDDNLNIAEAKDNTPAENTAYIPCPGSAGCRYYENEKCFMTGSFLDKNGSRVRLDITREGESDQYLCTVTAADVFGSYYVWGFSAAYNDGTLVYNRGALSYLTYDSEGSITDNKIVTDVHSGSIKSTANGLEWTDSDGTSYVFVK